jgi:hypothetical protein
MPSRRVTILAAVAVLATAGCGDGRTHTAVASGADDAWCRAIAGWAEARTAFAEHMSDDNLERLHKRKEGMDALAPLVFRASDDPIAKGHLVEQRCGAATAELLEPGITSYSSSATDPAQPPSTTAPAPGTVATVATAPEPSATALAALATSHTLTVAADGCGVIRTEAQPEPGGLTWAVLDHDGFEVLGRNALGETRYRYFEGGEYTVKLTAWGGESYVPVSNTVTIRC